MKLTAHYPSVEVGSDPIALRDYAQAAEQSGYSRITMGEHILGADPERPGGWDGPYTHEHEWPAPFPTFAYVAAVTERIELMTGILILPQRQTALVAKQAAELDVLSGGRFVLGVGTGWNAVEYEALGENFHDRGRRIEEQVALLRALWGHISISFEGRWHQVSKAGINPLPSRRDIPIWMGGSDERVLDRVGRIGDGWFPLGVPLDACEEGIARIRQAATEAGRDANDIGLQCIVAARGDVERQVETAKAFEAIGATHVAFVTNNARLASPGEHIQAIRAFAEAYGKA